ncbi:MAG TPA: hypothetical protein VFB04_15775 [Terriglobales bacterium]|nr:hypothetical protein [Terriglobales bacterium]
MASATVLGCPALPPPSANEPQAISACGATIDLTLQDDSQSISRDLILTWINRAQTAVCTYYGRYPVPHVSLLVQVRGRPGVHGGVTYPAENGARIRISVGPGTTQAQLNDDWMLTHEMIHPAFPYMSEEHHWIEEGISVYVEPIARVQAGQLSATQMWHDVVRDMPQGEPESGDRGLDHTHNWGRTYWGGALFCLVADVRIREQTHNRKGLQDALRGIVDAGGRINEDWPIERAFSAGDKATGTTVLMDLYHQMSDKPAPVDLDAIWQKLGIQRRPGGEIELTLQAPEANIREAITKPPKVEPSHAELQTNAPR